MSGGKLRGYEFWNKVCKEVKHVVAPMVDASELPWRLLSRKYNAHLTYTPMFNSGQFAISAKYRQREFTPCQADRPLFVQFCGDDPETLLQAARHIEDHCDAIDINLGCPQNIAKKGHYGAFLMEEWGLVESIVRHLDQNLKIPVTCKIRVFPEVEKTIEYAKMLERAGCSVLTVHGRLREQKGANTGLADWEKIKLVKQSLSIPVIANGNVLYYEDVLRCLERTGADAVMSAEGNLYNPAIFGGTNPSVWEVSDEYLSLCRQFPPPSFSALKGHIFKMWHCVLKEFPDYRAHVGRASSIEEMEGVTKELAEKVKSSLKEKGISEEALSYSEKKGEGEGEEEGKGEGKTEEESEYYQTISYWRCQPYVRRLPTEEVAKIWANKDLKYKQHFLNQTAKRRKGENEAHPVEEVGREEEASLAGDGSGKRKIAEI